MRESFSDAIRLFISRAWIYRAMLPHIFEKVCVISACSTLTVWDFPWEAYTERAFLDAPESAAEHAGESEFRSSVPHSAFFILPITADSPAAGLLAESPASTGRVTMLIVTAASLRLYRP